MNDRNAKAAEVRSELRILKGAERYRRWLVGMRDLCRSVRPVVFRDVFDAEIDDLLSGNMIVTGHQEGADDV